MKFRIFDSITQAYVTDSMDYVLTPDGKLIDRATKTIINSPRYIVEFSTETYDKNGKEIYEGDVVSMQGYNGKHITIVYFQKGKFAVDGSHYSFKDLAPKTYEVIGNKHTYVSQEQYNNRQL